MKLGDRIASAHQLAKRIAIIFFGWQGRAVGSTPSSILLRAWDSKAESSAEPAGGWRADRWWARRSPDTDGDPRTCFPGGRKVVPRRGGRAACAVACGGTDGLIRVGLALGILHEVETGKTTIEELARDQ